MPEWKLRSPESFAPVIAQAAIRSKASDEAMPIPLTFNQLQHAKGFQKQIHFWRFCLRESPGHPLHQLETKSRITSSIKPIDDEPGKYRVYIHVKRQLYDYISHLE